MRGLYEGGVASARRTQRPRTSPLPEYPRRPARRCGGGADTLLYTRSSGSKPASGSYILTLHLAASATTAAPTFGRHRGHQVGDGRLVGVGRRERAVGDGEHADLLLVAGVPGRPVCAGGPDGSLDRRAREPIGRRLGGGVNGAAVDADGRGGP